MANKKADHYFEIAKMLCFCSDNDIEVVAVFPGDDVPEVYVHHDGFGLIHKYLESAVDISPETCYAYGVKFTDLDQIEDEIKAAV